MTLTRDEKWAAKAAGISEEDYEAYKTPDPDVELAEAKARRAAAVAALGEDASADDVLDVQVPELTAAERLAAKASGMTPREYAAFASGDRAQFGRFISGEAA